MGHRKLFRNRADAGIKLAAHLVAHRHVSPVVLALPRGGVPVAYEVAHTLGAPLDVCVVRKLGAPLEPELGLGAIGEDGTVYVDHDNLRRFGVTEDELSANIEAKRAAIEAEVKRLRKGSPPMDVQEQTVIVVDDGVASGGTARAALLTLRARGAGYIVLAVPVGASETLDELASIADEIVCLHPEETFYAVSPWYEDFSPTSEETVIELLARSRSELEESRQLPAEARRRRQSERLQLTRERDVEIPVDGAAIEGRLTIPPDAQGLIVLPHGAGSSRRDAQSQYVAGILQLAKLATLRLDLLTEAEAEHDARASHVRSDLALLVWRLVAATDWARQAAETSALDLGYLGTGVGAAVAIGAAAERPGVIHAVVCRGGRLDLVEPALGDVRAPTLLIVGGLDADVLRLNRESLYFLECEKRLEIVHEASGRFDEPGALESAARHARRWFLDHLRKPAARSTA